MVLGWRRAFCTSIPRDKEKPEQPQQQPQSKSNSSTPKFGSKFGFFSNSISNPTTPRPNLRCRTSATVPLVPPSSSVPVSPKLQCKTRINRATHSVPTSPRSPSTFSLLKSTLRLSKSRCGICLQSVKRGQGMAIFTAECSHNFHFPCIAGHVKKQGSLSCPVCTSLWKEMPLLSVQNAHPNHHALVVEEENKREKLASRTDDVSVKKNERKQHLRSDLKVYNDDEPLMPLTPGSRFNPIPESDENFDEDSGEFQGFFVDADNTNSPRAMDAGNVEVTLSPEAAVVSAGRSCETCAVVLKVKAPKAPSRTERRAPIDLVTVVDVSGNMTGEKLQMMKRVMRLVISSLSSSDRLSIIAFSSGSKRLLPLRRMTTTGRRSARRIVDALAVLEGTSSAGDAVKKAAKVLEDRRERNPAVSILVLSEGGNERPLVSSTRYSHMEIPVHTIGLNRADPTSDVFSQCVGGLLSVVVQDLRVQLGFVPGSSPAEIASVYSHTCRPSALGSSSIRIGDLCAEEEREFLVELKVIASAVGSHQVLSVRCSYRDSATQELVYGKEQALLVPRPHGVRSLAPGIQRLRSLFITTRALAESRRLAERNDSTGAYHMLASARALMLQSNSASANEFILVVEAEIAELQRRRVHINERQQGRLEREVAYMVDEKGEPLTPTSAWRVAERLAKVAMMRKSLNRVGDLHGFEDARF